jgi:hypothetical protein
MEKRTLFSRNGLQMDNTQRHRHTKCNSKAPNPTSNTNQYGKPRLSLKSNSLLGLPRMKRSSRWTILMLGAFSITPHAHCVESIQKPRNTFSRAAALLMVCLGSFGHGSLSYVRPHRVLTSTESLHGWHIT